MRKEILLITALIAAPASAQLPFLKKYPATAQSQMPVQSPFDALRGDFALQSGGTSVYFAPGSAVLSAQAQTMLVAQAMWLRQHPELALRIEGFGDPADTRDHALALGLRRASEARQYLILLGVPEGEVSAVSWGIERPGPPSIVSTLVEIPIVGQPAS